MRRAVTLVAAVLFVSMAALVLVGCGGQPKGEPGITGVVQSVDRRPDGGLTMLVVAPADKPGTMGDKASVTVVPKTPVVDASGKRIGAGAILPGATVQVWFEGPVAESYPVQGKAGYVKVTADAPPEQVPPI